MEEGKTEKGEKEWENRKNKKIAGWALQCPVLPLVRPLNCRNNSIPQSAVRSFRLEYSEFSQNQIGN